MAAVEIEKIKKKYGDNTVLHQIDLGIKPGEFVVLVGPSGCGKSTLLRMIAGLEPITGGTLSIGGKVVNDLSPQDRGVAMVFQNYALYPHMSVRDNMAFSLKLAKVPAKEIESRVNDAAAILGIQDHLPKKPGQLSGGQKQRVAMGRAMVRRPAVFLFDEPLSNLDAQLRVKMRSEISLLHRRLNSTIVYVTHDQVEAMTLADRVAVMNKGYLEQVGPPMELYKNPRTRFVASFIGTPSMNFVPVAAFPGTSPAGTDSVGFRPEATRLDGKGMSLGQGIVTLVEPLGSTAYVHLKVGENALIAEQKAAPFPDLEAKVAVGVDEKEFFFFDREGKRL